MIMIVLVDSNIYIDNKAQAYVIISCSYIDSENVKKRFVTLLCFFFVYISISFIKPASYITTFGFDLWRILFTNIHGVRTPRVESTAGC